MIMTYDIMMVVILIDKYEHLKQGTMVRFYPCEYLTHLMMNVRSILHFNYLSNSCGMESSSQ